MSTYLYLECLDHDPPLRAAEESAQHTYDLPRIHAELAEPLTREQWAAEADTLQRWYVHERPPFEDFTDFDRYRYYRMRTAAFLAHHAGCRVGIRDEYGETHPTERGRAHQTHLRQEVPRCRAVQPADADSEGEPMTENSPRLDDLRAAGVEAHLRPIRAELDAIRDDLRDRIARALRDTTGTWADPLDGVHDIPPIVSAVLAELASWDTLMALLDQHWPESLFPTLEDDVRRDAGVRIVSLLRWVDRLRAESAGGEVISVEWGVQTDELGSVDTFESREQAEAERRSYMDGPLPLARITTEVVSPSGDTTATSPNDDTVPRALYEAEHKRANDSAEKLRETRERVALTERVSVETEPITDAPTDEAIRAEAWRLWPELDFDSDLTYPRSALREHNRGSFQAGARWAREQTAPTVAPDPDTLEQVLLTAWREAERGIIRHQAEAVAAADPRRTESEVKAEALEEAADELSDDPTIATLYHRAARLREGGGQ